MTGNKKDLKSTITTTFTFDDVINIFSDIDEKIISLHQCSSEDFLGLNKQFREFHNESKVISDNAQKVLDLITQDKTLEALRNLQILKEQLKTQIEKLDLFISNTNNIISGTIAGIERILFALRNLRQNLTTIKFLITNLNLEASYNKSSDDNTESAITDLFSSKVSIIKDIHATEQVFMDIKNILNDNQNKLSLLSGQNSYALEKSFISITKKINKLLEIRQSALKAIPRLKEITEESRGNVSQIITNLQYHDIIKQKIEHIQLTHRNLVHELDKISKEDGSTVLRHNHAKFFLKLRDIAGLQAAQLIHANKSYQNAIREITNSLKDTGESMTKISQLCNQFVSRPELFEILQEKDLQLQLEKLSDQVNTDKDHIEELSGSTIIALQKLRKVKDFYPSLHESIKMIISDVRSMTGRFKKIDHKENNNVGQIDLLINESDELIRNTCEEIDRESKNLFSLHKTQSSFIAGRTGYLNKLYSTTDELLSSREKSISEQLGTLHGHIKEGSNITQSIRNSIDQVKYYDFFEKVIEEIIYELNNINYKLKSIDSQDEDLSKEKNLAYLKNHYTMESEHRIHDSFSRITDNGNNTQPISIDLNEQEDEDNLELF
jgi:hypothetical protein